MTVGSYPWVDHVFTITVTSSSSEEFGPGIVLPAEVCYDIDCTCGHEAEGAVDNECKIPTECPRCGTEECEVFYG